MRKIARFRNSRSRYQDRMTLEEIGAVLGVSRQMVQLIEKSAMRKLRAAFGSTATGGAGPYIYDSEGVREPEGGIGHDRAAASAKIRRGASGRFQR